MRIGQRSGLRHLSLGAVRQPGDKFAYVTGEAMREKVSCAYGILENSVRSGWGSASCLERQEGSLETILDPGGILQIAVSLLEGRHGVIASERRFHFGKN